MVVNENQEMSAQVRIYIHAVELRRFSFRHYPGSGTDEEEDERGERYGVVVAVDKVSLGFLILMIN